MDRRERADLPDLRDLRAQAKSRREEAEAWWAFLSRVMAFMLGGSILTYETLLGTQRLYIIIAAVALCGPAVASGMATMISALRGGGSR